MDMNLIDISVLNPSEALSTFAATWQDAATGKEPIPHLAFGSLGKLFSAISAKRLDLLHYVATHEGLNVRQLAQSLQRDYKNVHTDVVKLLERGLLERNEQGLLSAPYDEILIHAELRHAA
jgi:predicted transcriptional regulator